MGLYAAALVGGVAFVVQQAANAGLRGALGTGIWAGFTNFAVGGAAILAIALLLREPLPTLAAAARAPWYAWTGGLLGALYIVGAVFLIPRIGAATVVALIVVGQMLASVVFDHLGALGLPEHPASLPRLAGAALLVVGAVLVTLY